MMSRYSEAKGSLLSSHDVGWERARETSHLLIPLPPNAWSISRWPRLKPGARKRSSIWLTGPQVLEPLLAATRMCIAGSWNGKTWNGEENYCIWLPPEHNAKEWMLQRLFSIMSKFFYPKCVLQIVLKMKTLHDNKYDIAYDSGMVDTILEQ